MEQHINKISSGQVIIELLVAFGLVSILLPALLTGLVASRNGKVQQEQRIQAVGLLREGEEAVRSIRDAGWENIETNGTYYPKISGSNWVWGTLPDATIGDFTRTINIDDVTPADPSLKKITITVTWGSSFIPSSTSSVLYLARWKNTFSTLSTSGTLINRGNGDWCAPSLVLGSVDLGNATAQTISAIQGQVTTGTGQAAAGFTFVNALLSDPPAPATPSASAIYTFDGPTKTNDVFATQNYAFIATDSHTKDIDIINLNSLSGGKYNEAGYFDSPSNGSSNASTVVVSGNVGYMTIGNMLYDFSLAGLPNTSSSRTAIHPAGLLLPAPATKMAVYNQRLYITTTSTSYQLVVVDASTLTYFTKPSTTPGKIHLDGLGGKSVYVDQTTGTRAYVATANSSNKNELFVVNTDESSPNYGATVGYGDTGAMDPTGIVLTNLPIVIVVGKGGDQYQVFRLSGDSPSRCNPVGFNPGDLNGIATVFTAAQRAFSYIITNTNSNQLKIIEGGPGGNGSGGGLTVESPIFNAGSTVVFNRIDITSLTPDGVTATYQIAVSPDCSTFNYTGSYSSAGGVIPLNINPGRCFRYKVTFSGGSGSGTAVSTTVSVNYSP